MIVSRSWAIISSRRINRSACVWNIGRNHWWHGDRSINTARTPRWGFIHHFLEDVLNTFLADVQHEVSIGWDYHSFQQECTLVLQPYEWIAKSNLVPWSPRSSFLNPLTLTSKNTLGACCTRHPFHRTQNSWLGSLMRRYNVRDTFGQFEHVGDSELTLSIMEIILNTCKNF